VAEFLQGFDGSLLQHEVYIYLFDASLMLIAMLILNWIHPSEIQLLLEAENAGVRLAHMN